jgi:hypothetical protein
VGSNARLPLKAFKAAAGMRCQYPYAIPLVRRAHGARADNAPLRVEPHLGKVSEHPPESSNKQSWRVLHEDVGRSYLANNPGHLTPKAAFRPADVGPLSGDGYVRAGKAARNDVNTSRPWSSVKTFNV